MEMGIEYKRKKKKKKKKKTKVMMNLGGVQKSHSPIKARQVSGSYL